MSKASTDAITAVHSASMSDDFRLNNSLKSSSNNTSRRPLTTVRGARGGRRCVSLPGGEPLPPPATMVRCSNLCMFVSLAVAAVFALILYTAEPFGGSAVGVATADGGSKAVGFNTSEAATTFRDLCQLYRQERVSGDFCNRLCYYDQLQFVDFFHSSKVVAILSTGGQKVALKSAHANFDAFDQLPDELTDEEFGDKVLEVANYYLELGWPARQKSHLIRMLWPVFERTHTISRVDRRSLWTLVNQEEYLTFKVLPLARVFPKVLGSCGHFYAVEYLVPFKLKSYYSNLKAKILVHLMGTLKLFYEFLNQPIHWCDVKFENFGLSAEYPKRFMIMDGDMVFTERRMRRVMENIQCRSDADCHFFDCTARCNVERERCSGRINDNIEVFCTKLVKQLFGNFWTKSNRYLAACHDDSRNSTQKLKELRVVWSWSLPDV